MSELNTNFLVNPVDPASQIAKATQINNVLLENEVAKSNIQNALVKKNIDVNKMQREDASRFIDDAKELLPALDREGFNAWSNSMKSNMSSNGYQNPYIDNMIASIPQFTSDEEFNKWKTQTLSGADYYKELLNDGKTTWSYTDSKGKRWPIEGKFSLEGIKKITDAKGIPFDNVMLGSGKSISGDETEQEYGQPKEGLDEAGNPITYVTDKQGNVKVLKGVKPKPGKGMKIYDPTSGNLLVDTSGGTETKPSEIEKASGKKFGEGLGERANKRLEQGFEAQNQNNQLDIVKEAIQSGSARTGLGEETLLNIRSLAETLGLDTGDLSGQELIRKVSNEMALRLRNPESGLGLTGNTSNKDLDFLKASVIGLARTERGNLKIIDIMQRFNNLKVKVAQEQQRFIKENKNAIPSDLDTKIMDFVNNYEILTPEERINIGKLTQKIKRTGTLPDGRKVIEFEDGTTEYAN